MPLFLSSDQSVVRRVVLLSIHGCYVAIVCFVNLGDEDWLSTETDESKKITETNVYFLQMDLTRANWLTSAAVLWRRTEATGCATLACMCAVDGEPKMLVRSGLKTEVSWLKKFICTSFCRSSGLTALGNSFWSSTIKLKKNTLFRAAQYMENVPSQRRTIR